MDLVEIVSKNFEELGIKPPAGGFSESTKNIFLDKKCFYSPCLRDRPAPPKLIPGQYTKQIVLFGLTGDGKSTFGSLILQGHDYTKDNAVFSTSSSAYSCTQNLKKVTGHWLGDATKEKITVIDTPGMNDTKCTDEDRLASIITDLQKLEYMNAFVMVFNGMNPRFSEAHKQMIAVYQSVFGIHLFTNMVMVFNRWPMTDDDKERREDEGITQETRAKEFNQLIREAFPHDFPPTIGSIPCFFLDSLDYIRKRKGHEEMETSLANLWTHMNQLPVYHTINMAELKKKTEETSFLRKSISALLKKMKGDKSQNDEKIKQLEREHEQMKENLQKMRQEEILANARREEIRRAEESRHQQRQHEADQSWIGQVLSGVSAIGKGIKKFFRW